MLKDKHNEKKGSRYKKKREQKNRHRQSRPPLMATRFGKYNQNSK